MIQARTRFVGRGFYQSLVLAVGEIVHRAAGDMIGQAHPSILDVGCGEGYLIGGVKHYLDERLSGWSVCYLGSDVSKEAVRHAARNHPEILFVVADTNGKLPFASIDLLINSFAPRNPVEFHRITGPGARAVVVIPTSRHLIEARQAFNLLSIQEEKERLVVEQLGSWFDLVRVQPLDYQITLGQGDLGDLIAMTPNFWHRAKRGIEGKVLPESLRTTVSLSILLFRRREEIQFPLSTAWRGGEGVRSRGGGLGLLDVELTGSVVVGEKLAVAAPIDRGIELASRFIRTQVALHGP